MASSSGILSYHLTRLSLNLEKNGGHHLVVLSGPKEQINGLSTELLGSGIDYVTSNHIDRIGAHDVYGCKKDIQRILQAKSIDIIHAQGAKHALPAHLAVRSLDSAKRPSIVTSVHSIPNEGLCQKPTWAAMTQILNVCSNIILPVSDNTRKRLICHGVNEKKAMTLHNAIDLEVFDCATRSAQMDLGKEKGKDSTIVCVANLVPTKGQDYYLRAAVEVLKKTSASFYVVGDGPWRQHLKELAHRLKVETSVIFTGRIQWPEIYFFLSNAANICVSASISENFPFYILECMAAGKPIIATNVGGVSEAIINGVNGFLIPARDPAAMASAILELVSNPERAQEMGASARKLAEHKFSMHILVKKLSDVYATAGPKND